MGALHYLTFVSNSDLKDYELLDRDIEYKYNQAESIGEGHDAAATLLVFANLAHESSISKIKEILDLSRGASNIEEYKNTVYNLMVSQFGLLVSDIIMLTIKNDRRGKTVADVEKLFFDTVEDTLMNASTYCNSILRDMEEAHDGSRLAMIIGTIGKTFPPRILYIPIPAFNKKTGEIVYCDGYSVNSSFDALYLCFVLCVKEKHSIRKCKMCGNYFIPVSKSNEIYCKDCRAKTYDTKVKNDEIVKAYRTIYKTQNARKQRNLHRPDIAQKFEKWKKYAKIKLQQCQNQKISIEEMKESISSDDWISDSLLE